MDGTERGLFRPALVSTLREGNEVQDREDHGTVRTVLKVETIHRVHFEPIPGHPDFVEWPAFGPESRQMARPPDPARGRRPAPQADLDASYDLADARAQERAREPRQGRVWPPVGSEYGPA